jgi:C-terminal processing protease CtpA/Prc
VQITSGALKDENPVWSPDGKQIAFLRNSRDVHIVNAETKQDRLVASSKFRTAFLRNPLSWSPDGEWLAFFSDDTRGFKNVAVVPASGGEAKPVSYLANMFADSVFWSADRRYVLFNTGQRTENNSIARVDLVPSTPKFREDQFRDLFHDEPQSPKPPVTPAVKPSQPVKITFEGIRRRLTFLPLGLDARAQAISPDGKTLLFTADAGGQENLYTYSLDDLARQPAVPRQLTSTAGRKSNAQFSPDGKEVFFIDAGHISVVVVDTRIVRPLAVTAELDIDFAKEKKEVFHQAWTILNETYYDPKFHGADWSALRDQYAPMIEGARTPDEVRRVISLMIGELNSSHSGINGGPSATRPPVTGRLGLDLDPSDNTVTAVVPLGPADIAGIKPGEKLLAIDGKTLDSTVNIDEPLQYKIGKRTILTTSAKKEIPVLPINTVTQKRLLYRQWVEDNRAYVHKISGGRLGYVHMLDMSSRALDQLHIDLDTENENRDGVVIDIRNNNGGFVNAYALDVFSRRPYLTMTPRDRPSSPARSMLGQRSLELPTVLVVNQNSLSDAEDFTEGYRTLKLGKVVGVPTAGWIIYTGGEDLIDGSALRTPSIRITANDGTDMELHPRPVDIEVGRPLGESYIGRDTQLERAVKSLLADLK